MDRKQIEILAGKIAGELPKEQPQLAAMLYKNLPRYVATLKFLLETPGPRASGPVLDYGCGYPLFLRLLRDGGLDAAGFEPYAEELHRRGADQLQVADVFFTRLPPGSQFGTVIMVDVIEHLSILRPTMTDVIARIRPGGYLLVSTPNGLRLSQWLAFVRRKKAHPTAIEKFLETDNNYVNHQREFTRGELELVVRHYGLEMVSLICVDTTPRREVLNAYHQLLGQQGATTPWRTRVRDFIQRSMPENWQNNFLMLARKPSA